MRVSNSQLYRVMLNRISLHRNNISKYGDEISTGLKVQSPGDSRQAGTVSRFQELQNRIEGHEARLSPAKALLTYQDDILMQANELLVRAKEIGSQAANETYSEEMRKQLGAGLFQLRDHMVSLANSTYQGRYIYGGAADDQPPYIETTPFDEPASGEETTRYEFQALDGSDTPKEVKLTDDLTLTITTPANEVFDDAIFGLERLARAVAGYQTNPADGQPDGTGTAYQFPDEYNQQSEDIRDIIDKLDVARKEKIMPERVSVGGRLRRIETGEALLGLSKLAGQEALSSLQEADVLESASKLTQAQTALEASLNVTSKLLSQTLMNYL